MIKKKMISLIVLLSSISIHAAEVDNFKAQRLNLRDETQTVNDLSNRFMSLAIQKANAKGSCNEAQLYEELQNYFANWTSGLLVKQLLTGDVAEIHRYHINQSIYKDWRFWDGLGLSMKILNKHEMVISPLIKINDVYIGIDKLEHMFGMGFKYYTKRYIEGESVTSVLEYGNKVEKYGLGGNRLMSGIFSHGDLSANFNGMRFWNHMLQKGNDVLGSTYNVGPYIRCENKKWVKTNNPLDFSHYIDQSMDESINCSRLPSQKAAYRMIDAIKNSGYKGLICAKDNPALQELKEKYLPNGIYRYLVNFNGLSKY